MDKAVAVIEKHFAAREAQAIEHGHSPTEMAYLAIDRLRGVFGLTVGLDVLARYEPTFELLRSLATIESDAASLVAAMYDGRCGLNVSALPGEARYALQDLCSKLDARGALAPYHREDGGIGIW